jgi:SpoVK/Ycf46/Vps4 family AAA+-type ATPase
VTRTTTAGAAPPARNEGHSWPELHRLVAGTLRAGISVLLRGHPGVGKSSLAARLAEELDLPLVDIRLAQRDPADLCGVWFPDREARQLVSFPPSWAVEAASRPCLLFLDEINAAVTKLHQAAAYQIVLERRVGELRLHPQTAILAAGNLEEDEAIVTPLSSALCNRFAHFIMRVDATAWGEWAEDAGIESSVRAYIERHGAEVLYAPGSGEPAFPTPRSWEMASRLLLATDEADHRRLVAACLGTAGSERFFAWRRLYTQIKVERVLQKGVPMDFTSGKQADPSYVYAVTHAVGAWLAGGGALTDAQLPNVLRFLRSPGLDIEYAFLCLRQVRRNDALFARLRVLPEFRALAEEIVDMQPVVRGLAA